MNKLKFHKMEGAGNDFIVIDNREQKLALDKIIGLTPKLCNRKFGIGADGILVLQQAEIPEADYTMTYRNADGSDAGMCGNGARCLAYFAFKNGFKSLQQFNVHENVYTAEIKEDNSVDIHFPVKVQPSAIQLNGYQLLKVDAATEHLVTFVDKEYLDNEEKLIQTGRALRYHKEMNPRGTNINFVHLENDHTIHLQTYERGVENLTLACGTGALASAIAAHSLQNRKTVHSTYSVKVKGGTLQASFSFKPEIDTYYHLILNGPANFVFEGHINI